MRKIFLSVLLASLSLSAQAANVLFSFGNPTNNLPYLSEVTLTPTNFPTTIGGVIVINETLKLKTDTNGQCVFTNLQPWRYLVHFTLAGKNTTSDFQITLTNALSDTSTIAASSIITAPTNSSPSGTTAYSMAAADARFYPRTSNPSNYANFSTSIIPSTAYFTNTPDLGFPVYALNLTAGQSYYFAASANLNEAVVDASFSVDIALSGFFTAPAGDPLYVISIDPAVSPVGGSVLSRVYSGTSNNAFAGTVAGDGGQLINLNIAGSDGLIASSNLTDLPFYTTARNFLLQSADNLNVKVKITNGLVQFGDPLLMSANAVGGTPQFSVYANMAPTYRGTNILNTSIENVMEIASGDRANAAYIGFSSGITNAGSAISMLSPFQDFQFGLSGDLYNRALGSPGSNFNRVGFIALNSPVDFCVSSTATKGTNSSTWAAWYYDNNNNKTWFGKNTGGASPRDSTYKGALVIDNTSGDVTITNGTTSVTTLSVSGTATANLFSGSGASLTALAGANITSGTINSNSLDAPTKAQLALAGTDATKAPTNAPTVFTTFTVKANNTNELAVAQGGATVAGLLTTKFLAFSGSAPSSSTNGGTALGGSGASITVDTGSTDSRGSAVVVTAASGTAASAKAGTITFNATKPAADFMAIPIPLNSVTAGSIGAPHFFFTNYTTTTMELWSCATAPGTATTYKIGWLCIQ